MQPRRGRQARPAVTDASTPPPPPVPPAAAQLLASSGLLPAEVQAVQRVESACAAGLYASIPALSAHEQCVAWAAEAPPALYLALQEGASAEPGEDADVPDDATVTTEGSLVLVGGLGDMEKPAKDAPAEHKGVLELLREFGGCLAAKAAALCPQVVVDAFVERYPELDVVDAQDDDPKKAAQQQQQQQKAFVAPQQSALGAALEGYYEQCALRVREADRATVVACIACTSLVATLLGSAVATGRLRSRLSGKEREVKELMQQVISLQQKLSRRRRIPVVKANLYLKAPAMCR